MSEDRALGDLPSVPIINTTVPPTPEDFDLAEFIAGVRPTRRAVQIFPQAHLIAQLEQIAAQIEAAPEDADVDDLIDQFEQVKAGFEAGIWFEIEKRSSEWVTKFDNDLVKQLGLVKKPPGGGQKPQLSVDDNAKVTLHRLAAQIVQPPGMTYELVKSLAEHNEGEVAKLMVCMTSANNELAESAEVLTRDFSSRRSTPSAIPDF